MYYYYLTKFVDESIFGADPEYDIRHVNQSQIILSEIEGDLQSYCKHFFYSDDDNEAVFKYVNISHSKTDYFKIIRSIIPLESLLNTDIRDFTEFERVIIRYSSDYLTYTPQYETLKKVSDIPFDIFFVMTD